MDSAGQSRLELAVGQPAGSLVRGGDGGSERHRGLIAGDGVSILVELVLGDAANILAGLQGREHLVLHKADSAVGVRDLRVGDKQVHDADLHIVLQPIPEPDNIGPLAGDDLDYFITVGNKNITMNGKVVAGEWADVIRFRDWLKNDMQVRVVNLFVTRPKVPYTDSGIGLVQNQMLASLKAGQDVGGIAEEEFDEDGNSIPGYTTSVPLAASLSASERASRRLTKCTFKARLAGAIHFAELSGSLTYEL